MAIKSSRQPASSTDFWAPFVRNSGNPFIASVSMQAKFAKAALECQIEVLDFLKARLNKDVAIVDRLSRAHETPEVFNSLSGFMQEAIDDYSQESVKFASFGSRMAMDTAQQLQKSTEEFANDLRSVASAA